MCPRTAFLPAGSGLLVEGSKISNAMQNGILGFYGIREVAVVNSTIENTGMVGMPKRSKGAHQFRAVGGRAGAWQPAYCNSAYIGIRVHKDAVVSNNLVDGACLRLVRLRRHLHLRARQAGAQCAHRRQYGSQPEPGVMPMRCIWTTPPTG
jgi:hypothetical protein